MLIGFPCARSGETAVAKDYGHLFPDTRVADVVGRWSPSVHDTLHTEARTSVPQQGPCAFLGCSTWFVAWEENKVPAEMWYLNRRRLRPRGVHSCAQKGRGGGSAPGWSLCPRISRRLGRWGQSHPQIDCSWGLPGLPHSPVVDRPLGQPVCSKDRHTRSPRSH